MALILVFWLLMAVTYLDARLLQRRSPSTYVAILRVSPLSWALLVLAFSAVTALIYAFRRGRYLVALRKLEAEADAPPATSPDPLHGAGSPPSPDTDASAPDDPAHAAPAGATPAPRTTPAAALLHDVPHFQTITRAAGVLIVGMSISMALSFLYGVAVVAAGRPGLTLLDVSLITLASNGVYLWLIYRIASSDRTVAFRELVSLSGVKFALPRDVLVPAGLGVALALGVNALTSNQSSAPVTPLGGMIAGSSGTGILVFVIMAVLAAPVLEELIFRGFFFRAVERVRGPQFAFLAIAAAFWLAHVAQLWGDPVATAALIPVSIVLTGTRWYTGWALPGIVLHFVYNTAVLVIPVVVLLSSGPWADYSAAAAAPPAERETRLQEIVASHPDFPPAHNDLAWLYATEDRNLDEALALVERALDYDPLNDAYLDTRAEVLFRMGRYDEAIEIERRLVSENPNEPFYREQLEKFERARDEARQQNEESQ